MKQILGFALGVFLALAPVAEAGAAQPGVVVRVPVGFEIRIPAGWFWHSLAEDEVTFKFPRPAGARSGHPEQIEVTFSHKTSLWDPNPNLANLRAQRMLPNGMEVLWEVQRGPYPDWWAVRALLPRGPEGGRIEVFSNYFSPAERPAVEHAFWEAVGSIRLLPPTRAIAHPQHRFSVEIPPRNEGSWRASVVDFEPHKQRIQLTGWLIDLVSPQKAYELRYVWSAILYIYPASAAITTLDAALADIQAHFVRAGHSYGPPQREEFPGGSALWVEAPGAKAPLLGVALREGRIFFVSCDRTTPNPSPGRELPGEAAIRDAFRNTLRSVRPIP